MSKLALTPTPTTGQDRVIRPRVPAPGIGIAEINFPAGILVRELPMLRRMTLYFWSRLRDGERQPATSTRNIRYIPKEAIPRPGIGDHPLEPVDLVLTVAGLIWPGLGRWREVRGSYSPQEMMFDWWWGHWGNTPGAVVIRDGILHMVHMDRDTDSAMRCYWMRWANKNWNGPVLHHAIQVLGEDPTAEASQILHRLGQRGGRSTCILWPSMGGLDLRPFRADLAKSEAVLRPVSDGIRVATTLGVPLSMSAEMVHAGAFTSWVDSLVVPAESRGAAPEITFLELEKAKKEVLSRVYAKPQAGPQPEQTPLFEDAVASTPEPESPLEKEFGVKAGADVEPARVQAMLNTAKSELMRAKLAHNRPKADYWLGITTILESWAGAGSAK